MKARIKATGEIAEVQVLGLYVTDRAQALYGVDEVEIIPIITELSTSIDWEQREWEASVAAMQGLLANRLREGVAVWDIKDYVSESIEAGNLLITEYQKQKP